MKKLHKMLTLAGCLLCLFWGQFAMAQTGTVQSFGFNAYGQVGDGTKVNRLLPTPALHISGIKAVACGAFHTLALDSNGLVWAWGYNGYGQLGTGDYTAHSEPVPVLGGIKAIAAGGYFSLALDYKGKVWAWGDNYQGQLGMGDYAPRLTPVQMTDPNNTVIKAIAAGGNHSLLINEFGALLGCGDNSMGQLAQPDFQTHPNLTFMSYGAIAAAAGNYHTLMLTSAHEVYATGYNSTGQLGDRTTTSRHGFDFRLPTGFAIRSIAAGADFGFAVSLDGRAFSWGDNASGQLGLGYTSAREPQPLPVPGVANVKEVAAGGLHSLILTADGRVLATGRNTEGQLGDGTTLSRSRFAPVHNAAFIQSIAAGFQSSVIFQPFTSALATGSNIFGQLGNGNTLQQNAPVPMVGVSHIIAVACGNASGYHSLLLRADGTVWACGSNQFGQLGNGAMTLNPNPTPTQVRGPKGVGFLSNIIAIAAGNGHSLALAADGTVYAWGLNNRGQLGLGNRTNNAFPVQIPFLKNVNYNQPSLVFAIAAGAAHSLLLDNDGQLYAAGWNDYGQLGLPGLTDHLSFEPSEGQNHQIAIAAGSGHSLSLKYTGEIFAWGNNLNGQLALGDNINRSFPALQVGTAAIAIACGGFHSLCLNGEGQLFDAGFNRYGQLGVGDTTDRNSWSSGSGMTGMSEIAAGNVHSLVANPFGTLLTAGFGGFGALGNGATNTLYTFFPVFNLPGVIRMAGSTSHTLILTAPLIQVASGTVSPTSVKGGTSATGTVMLNGLAGPGGQRVYLSCYSLDQNGQYVNAAAVPAYIDVAPASKTATFPITTTKVGIKTVTTINAYLNQTVSISLTIQP